MREKDPVYDFTELSLYKIGRQVAHGMDFLANSKIIHGDVAARNMLVGEVNSNFVSNKKKLSTWQRIHSVALCLSPENNRSKMVLHLW